MYFLTQLKFWLRSIPFHFQRFKIKAVHEDDLDTLLESLGLAQGIADGKYPCMYCEKQISIENLWGISYKGKQLQFICSNHECISSFE